MFFKKKIPAVTLTQEWEERFQNLENIVSGNLEQLMQEIGQLRASANKHDMSIEDMLETWEEQEEKEEELRNTIKNLQETEQKLLSVFEIYMDHFFDMKHFAETRDEEWVRQMKLMDVQSEHCRKLSGLEVVDRPLVQVDYDLHEVIKVVPTEDAELGQKVASVYRCGYLYKGKVMRKAQVCVYRLETSGDGNKDCM